MTEERYDRLLDIADTLGDETEGYFPTVDEMMRQRIEETILKHSDRYLPILLYMSGDPLSRTDNAMKDSAEYKEAVKYARDILYKYELTEDDPEPKAKTQQKTAKEKKK